MDMIVFDEDSPMTREMWDWMVANETKMHWVRTARTMPPDEPMSKEDTKRRRIEGENMHRWPYSWER